MSRFFNPRYAALTPYTPGEQPRDMAYIKLNTNESPFPPAPGVLQAVAAEVERLRLYSDPQCTVLRQALAARYGVGPEQVMVGNGSDEVLNFAFMAFAGPERPLAFPDITYGFYPVFANLNGIPCREVPLRADFTIDPADYQRPGETVVVANPNAPTGLCLGPEAIEAILAADRQRVVIVDEAYVDFGGVSAIPLVERYDNLLVVQTFSKSRSLAGGRLGFAVGNEALINDLERLRYSTNPYNVNRMTLAAGAAALAEDDYYMDNCRAIAENRARTVERLTELGFQVVPSCANFLFVRTPRMEGGELYRALKARGVLVRHFDKPRIKEYIRITIGTMDQMEALVQAIENIFEEGSL